MDFLEGSYFWNDMQLSHCVDNNITHILPSGWQNKANKAVILHEAALYRCFHKYVFWKYAANLQEKTHAEVQFQ